MAQIILDFGSGNTCRNDWPTAKRMIDQLKAVDSGKHSVVIKWQLFQKAGDNIPLDREIFKRAYDYAAELGYKTTSSVFDKASLDFLLGFEIPFVKVANRRELDWLVNEIPRKTPVYVSYGANALIADYYCSRLGYCYPSGDDRALCCVSDYPASLEDYEGRFWPIHLHQAVSDHTTDFELWHKHQPQLVEWHYKLPDSTGLDAGPFARTPEQLREILS